MNLDVTHLAGPLWIGSHPLTLSPCCDEHDPHARRADDRGLRREMGAAARRRAEKKKWANAFRSFWAQGARPHHPEVC